MIVSSLGQSVLFCATLGYKMTTQYEGPQTDSPHSAMLYSPITNLTLPHCLSFQYTQLNSIFEVRLHGKIDVRLLYSEQTTDGIRSSMITIPPGLYQLVFISTLTHYSYQDYREVKAMVEQITVKPGACQLIGIIIIIFV